MALRLQCMFGVSLAFPVMYQGNRNHNTAKLYSIDQIKVKSTVQHRKLGSVNNLSTTEPYSLRILGFTKF